MLASKNLSALSDTYGEKGKAMEQKRAYPVEECVYTEQFGYIPVLDIRRMDDAREKELGAQSAAKWAASMEGKERPFTEHAVLPCLRIKRSESK